MSSTKENKGELLKFKDCMGFCIGQIIGSGIMVLTGIALAKTGQGVPLGFIVAAGIIMITMVPLAVLGAGMPGTGGNYVYVRELIGRKSGFVYVVMFAVSQCLISTFALGFADYLTAVVPGVNRTAAAMALLVICTAFNMAGVKLLLSSRRRWSLSFCLRWACISCLVFRGLIMALSLSPEPLCPMVLSIS